MTNLNRPVLAGHLLDALYFSVRDGKKIYNIPGLIEQLLAEDIWKKIYIEETEQTISYDKFEDLITSPPPEGLGVKVKDLEKMLGDNKEIQAILSAALQGMPGSKIKSLQKSLEILEESKAISSARKNSRSQNIRKLRENHPDILQQVLDKKITINEGMVQAGYKKKRISVYAEVEPVVEKLKSEFSKKEIDKIVKLLQDK